MHADPQVGAVGMTPQYAPFSSTSASHFDMSTFEDRPSVARTVRFNHPQGLSIVEDQARLFVVEDHRVISLHLGYEKTQSVNPCVAF